MIRDYRRAKRHPTPDSIRVTDAMTDAVVGRLGNLSQTGMLLITSERLTEDALYQFRFSLPDPVKGEVPIDVGAHLLWVDQSNTPNHYWTGLRFIAVTEEHARRIRHWIRQLGGE